MMPQLTSGAMLNAYPDSMGGTLDRTVQLLQQQEFQGAFDSFYILPSVFHSDLDRGFSLIDYDLNEDLASLESLEQLRQMGISLTLDFILNHISVRSPQFQDMLRKGDASEYRDFFLNWNKFWEGKGEMMPEGYIRPIEEYIHSMHFRKEGLPILMIRFPDGKEVPYWNTFYQEIFYDPPTTQTLRSRLGMTEQEAEAVSEICRKGIAQGRKPVELEYGELSSWKPAVTDLLESGRSYLGQMDLNIQSDTVRQYYHETLTKLAGYHAKIIRLDAFAYASKVPGKRNFMNDPETWDLLSSLNSVAEPHGLTLLPEIHASYGEETYAILAEKGFPIYDFFLPGLLIDAFIRKSGAYLCRWGTELVQKGIQSINMLGCHDGIPLLDLKGLLPEEDIQRLIATVVDRGGIVKDLHGAKNVYYQVNATYFSALGEDENRLLLARAVQMFMPGKPQIWYLDLFAGKNDYAAVQRGGSGAHKEINRTNLTVEEMERALHSPVVLDQLELLQMRNRFSSFQDNAVISFLSDGSRMVITRQGMDSAAVLNVDFLEESFAIEVTGPNGTILFQYDSLKNHPAK